MSPYCPLKEAERRRRRMEENPEAIRAYKRKWRENNREAANQASREAKRRRREISREADRLYREANKEKIDKSNAAYRINNREKMCAASDRWRRNNPGKVNARTARRTAAKLQATPPWVDLKAIEAFYHDAARLTRETGIVHEVDHIWPLRGKNSCGLHVPWNLQILTRSANRSKGNKEPEV